jgi:hypothetical protein
MGWDEATETFEQWTRKGTLTDFKTAHRVGLESLASLRKVRAGAEYKYVTIRIAVSRLRWRPTANCSASTDRPSSTMTWTC